MKRTHLFEFEDYPWFPNWLRKCMTRYIVAFHRILKSKHELAKLLAKALPYAKEPHIVDLCSGSGGPMLDVLEELKQTHHLEQVKVTFSDLYPNLEVAEEVQILNDPHISYRTEPLDATKVDPSLQGVRTMICSLHHMKPAVAKQILADAKQAKQPFLAFELSDNRFPNWLMWPTLPLNVLTVLLITPFVRPMSWQQLVFTYLIPLLPIFIGWDGAVSNVRTYTMEDMEKLTKDLQASDYQWEMGTLEGKPPKLYL
ncbi:MAG: hypothetical protein AAF399_19905, partial [Bacteroidota bacterium]